MLVQSWHCHKVASSEKDIIAKTAHTQKRQIFDGRAAVSPACLSIINLCADSFIAMSQFFKGAKNAKLKALRDPAVLEGRICVCVCVNVFFY